MNEKLTRTMNTEFKTRNDEDGKKFIEGYFVVFGDVYEIGEGMSESVDPRAFDNTLDRDIRFLIDHDTRLVLGRTKAGTAEIKVDSYGVWGKVEVNPNDQDAMNLYARVQRGDVNQCSFGFEIVSEDTEFDGDDVHWTIREVKLYELSVCTFPAYEATQVNARKSERDEMLKRKNELWKSSLIKKLRGEVENA